MTIDTFYLASIFGFTFQKTFRFQKTFSFLANSTPNFQKTLAYFLSISFV